MEGLCVKKLLTVAINSYNVAPLRGCVNDSNNILAVCAANGYQTVQLIEDQATKHNIMTKLLEISKELVAGDKFMFHYSGHGSQIPCNDGTETDDLMEVLCPFDLINPDGSWNNTFIMDNELHDIFCQFAPGVEIECLLDCCHSGTATRDLKPNVAYRYISAGVLNSEPTVVKFNVSCTREVICWSGCKDEQTSADAFLDGTYQGAFTAALLKSTGTRRERFAMLTAILKQVGFPQEPQLTCAESLLDQPLF
jgi:hypothetical protein